MFNRATRIWLAGLLLLAVACWWAGRAEAQPPPPEPAGDPLRLGAPVLIVQADGSMIPGVVARCWVPAPGSKGLDAPAVGPSPPPPTATAVPTGTPVPRSTRPPREGATRTPTLVIPGSVTVVQATPWPTPGGPGR